MESTETEVKTPVAVSKEALIRVVHERDDEKRREAILTILGLDTEASIKDIDRAFRQFALNHHPELSEHLFFERAILWLRFG